MGNPDPAHEPSMEEILASIRQIISDDTEEEAGSADAASEDALAGEAASEAAPQDESATEAAADEPDATADAVLSQSEDPVGQTGHSGDWDHQDSDTEPAAEQVAIAEADNDITAGEPGDGAAEQDDTGHGDADEGDTAAFGEAMPDSGEVENLTIALGDAFSDTGQTPFGEEDATVTEGGLPDAGPSTQSESFGLDVGGAGAPDMPATPETSAASGPSGTSAMADLVAGVQAAASSGYDPHEAGATNTAQETPDVSNTAHIQTTDVGGEARDDRLLSHDTGEAVSGAFNALTHTILAQNARTLDDLVREMLEPMLKEWLDDNLPSLVERMVREEIDRVSRGRR